MYVEVELSFEIVGSELSKADFVSTEPLKEPEPLTVLHPKLQ